MWRDLLFEFYIGDFKTLPASERPQANAYKPLLDAKTSSRRDHTCFKLLACRALKTNLAKNF